jgi:hypothetical protein
MQLRIRLPGMQVSGSLDGLECVEMLGAKC